MYYPAIWWVIIASSPASDTYGESVFFQIPEREMLVEVNTGKRGVATGVN